jgi:hypothetical protein
MHHIPTKVYDGSIMSNLAEKKMSDDASQKPAPPEKKSRRGIIALVILLVLVVAGVVIYRKVFPDYDRPVVDEMTSEERSKLADKLQEHLQSNGDAHTKDGHPLDPALKIADEGLKHIQANIVDYTCILTKQERLGDKLADEQQMFCKVRNRKEKDGKITTPLSVYMRFIKPSKGREVIWVEGENEGKLTAHEPGLRGKVIGTVHLDPEGKFAMIGQLHPISQTGFENLVFQLIARGFKELKHEKSETEVDIVENAEFNGRKCRKIVVRHPRKSDRYEFFEGRIFVDNEWNIPIHYSAYLWPEEEGGDLPLIESYSYSDIKLNAGLTDKDFDYENEEYDFP